MGGQDPGRISMFEGARLTLARMGLRVSDELVVALERAARVSARTLETERVSVWLLDPAGPSLRCVTLFERTPARTSSGEVLDLSACPSYDAALRTRKFVAADDAVTDPRTRELAEAYLVPNGIVSMLDAPLFRGGEVFGVVCHEHTGTPRTWSERDMDFAGSVADILSTLFEHATRLAAEEAERHMERMASLGRLAAGVAHDFNGILGVVALNASLVESVPNLPPKVHDSAKDILETVDMGRRLVGQLMSFARVEPASTEAIDVALVVRAMGGLFTALHAQCHVEMSLPEGELHTVIRRAQLEQVVMNLVLNARDASPHGATVHVRVRGETRDGRRIAVIEVEDAGHGIPPDVRQHVFEPFFTTATPGQGTGMGLATVLSIVEQCGGTVEVESEVGRGSVFTVRLPRTDP